MANRFKYDKAVREATYRIEDYMRRAAMLAVALEGDNRAGLRILHDHIEALRDELEAWNMDARRRRMSRTLRKTIFERDAYRCVRCGDWHSLEIDHIVPLIEGGGDELENLQTLCRMCNSKKGGRLEN